LFILSQDERNDLSKYRYVNTRIWSDTYIARLSDREKLLFVYAITNVYANICGVYEIQLSQISADLNIPIDKIESILTKFRRDQKMVYHNGYLAVLNFVKHQNSESPKIKKGIELARADIPKEVWDEIENVLNGEESPVQLSLPVVAVDKEDKVQMVNGIVGLWNAYAEKNSLSLVNIVSDKRAKCIKARLEEKEFDFHAIMQKVIHSNYLLGRVVDWKVNFDFIFCSKNNYIKILEGNYDNKTKSDNTAVQSIVDVARESMEELNGT